MWLAEKWTRREPRDLVHMLDQVRSIQQQYRESNRLIGDTTVNILTYHLRKHLSRHTKFVTRAWVEDCRNEFDLLLVSRNAKPVGLTNLYRKEDVHVVIEVKTSGSRDSLNKFSRQLNKFKQIGKDLGKRTVYLSLLHSPKYAKEAVRILGKDTFVLQIRRRTVEVNESDWRRLVRLIESIR